VSRQLLLLRHGRTAFNAAGRFQGQVDVPLDEVGRDQAARVGPLIASRNPVVVISSDSSRAADTAAAVADAAGLTLTFDERLREIDVGGWSGRTLDEVEVEFTQEYKDWISGNREELRRGGGETYAEVGFRAYECVRGLLDGPPEELVVAVTHGGTARSLIDLMLGIPVGARHILGGIPNAGWSRLDKGRFGWRLAEHAVTADLRLPSVQEGFRWS
jgi:broad specificity phosphatase PhoE